METLPTKKSLDLSLNLKGSECEYCSKNHLLENCLKF